MDENLSLFDVGGMGAGPGARDQGKPRPEPVPSEPGPPDGLPDADWYFANIKGAIRIPAGTPERICAKCPALIFWVGKQPVSIDSYKGGPRGFAPTAVIDGAGISHYATCPRAADFRK